MHQSMHFLWHAALTTLCPVCVLCLTEHPELLVKELTLKREILTPMSDLRLTPGLGGIFTLLATLILEEHF